MLLASTLATASAVVMLCRPTMQNSNSNDKKINVTGVMCNSCATMGQ
jgi:hypothetical protein